MITELRLQGFKNFLDATLPLGNLTLLVGTNASGKSNIRDAFRFLHGVSRGYTLAEIIGEKWIEGGVLQWKGIRGGTQEVGYCGNPSFSLQVELSHLLLDEKCSYRIRVALNENGHPPSVLEESLIFSLSANSPPEQGFVSKQSENSLRQGNRIMHVRLFGNNDDKLSFPTDRPFLFHARSHPEPDCFPRMYVDQVLAEMRSIRFLDLTPDAMRIPSISGHYILGDRGENLSSVLHTICESKTSKQTILEWLRELTPQDVVDFEFVPDQTGKILVTLVESNGQKTSAYSASDGTLRFLAIIAAMLGPRPAKFYFFEELENGIHPTRLHFLLQLIEQKVSEGNIQVVATTHSPQLLGYLGETSKKSAALIYRLPDQPDARIVPIMQIPEAKRILEEQDLARLFSTGWLEDAVAFREGAEA